MADNISSKVINMNIDGVATQVIVDEQIYKALNSNDFMIKEQAFRLIERELKQKMSETAPVPENPSASTCTLQSALPCTNPSASTSAVQSTLLCTNPSASRSAVQSTLPCTNPSASRSAVQSTMPCTNKEPEEHADTDNTVFVWTDKHMKALFHVRAEMEEDFQKAKAHTTLWRTVSDTLGDQGCNATALQCMNKWKNLKKDFMKTVDNNNKTGQSPRTCKFFEEFSELYGCKSSTKPEATMSSLKNDSPVRAARKRKNTESPMLTFVKEHSKKQEELIKARDTESQKRHAEKMELMGKFLGVFEKLAKN